VTGHLAVTTHRHASIDADGGAVASGDHSSLARAMPELGRLDGRLFGAWIANWHARSGPWPPPNGAPDRPTLMDTGSQMTIPGSV
jgi:hypothetical protein